MSTPLWQSCAVNNKVLAIMQRVLFLGGLVGLGGGVVALFSGSEPEIYGVLGIGGGFWLLSSAITIHIREQITR